MLHTASCSVQLQQEVNELEKVRYQGKKAKSSPHVFYRSSPFGTESPDCLVYDVFKDNCTINKYLKRNFWGRIEYPVILCDS